MFLLEKCVLAARTLATVGHRWSGATDQPG
jgi:hypothetical protein